jgi:hypothetical protein
VTLEHLAATCVQTKVRIGEIQLVARPGNSHVEKWATVLLDAGREPTVYVADDAMTVGPPRCLQVIPKLAPKRST